MTAARPDWQKFFAEPQAPERYGEAAATKFVNEKRQKQEDKAQRSIFSASITDVVVLDGTGAEMLRSASPPGDPSSSVRLIEFITSTVARNVTYLSGLPIAEDVQVRWFGFDIRDMMHMACIECMKFNAVANESASVTIPAGIWYYRHFQPAPFIDPYETLVPSGMRDDVDLFSLCEFMGIPVPPTLGENAAEKAELARQLAVHGQFWPR